MNEMFKQRMTVDEFIPWAMAQPCGRYELHNGEDPNGCAMSEQRHPCTSHWPRL